MKRRSTVLNPIAPAVTTGAIALGLTLAGSPAAVAGPLGEWFGLVAAPQAQSAEAAEGAVAPPPATGADDGSAAALRERLEAAERRVAELEAELEKTRAQAAWLGEELEASWRWIEELNAVLADERPAAADREPVETAAAPEQEPAAAARAEREPVETAAAAPEAADDRGRPGDADSGGIAARLARALEQQGRPGGGSDDGGIAARLARTLDALGSRRPSPAATDPDPGGLRTTGPWDEDGPPAAAAARQLRERPQQQGEDASYYAATQPVNLRAEPTTSAEVLAVVEADDAVRLLDRERGWFRVRYTTPSSREVTGWVYGEFLREIESGEALAVLAPPA